MSHKLLAFLLIYILSFSTQVNAHENHAEATYLGNEGVMIEHGHTKILFDPFFHNDYGQFQLVPEKIINQIFENQTPYNNISAIFISHAHEDHFDPNQLIKYLTKYPKVKFVGPQQAIDNVKETEGSSAVLDQMIAVSVKHQGPVETVTIGDIFVEAVFLPHAGWPRTKNVENVGYRVTIDGETTVMHLGDADQTEAFFSHYDEHWNHRKTQMAFPPFWFLNDDDRFKVLENHINAQEYIGIHVPIKVPDDLKQSKRDYFSQPGEKAEIKPH